MRLYQDISCRVYLLGCLQEKPYLMMDANGDYIATIMVNRHSEAHLFYRVFIHGETALRIRQYGFIGLHLWIEGDFQNNGEIIAEKIQFLDFSRSGDANEMVINCYF